MSDGRRLRYAGPELGPRGGTLPIGSLPLERPALAAAAALAATRCGDRVLDLGTGTGAMLARAGLVVQAVRLVERGYRSWCVLASR